MNSGKSGQIIYNIPGVDSNRGLALYSGDNGMYLSVLHAFVSNALGVIEKLRNVTAETLSSYVIAVHGLKGICASIGAEKIAHAAYNLEKTSRESDLQEVLLKNASLINDTETLVAHIQTWLKENDSAHLKPILTRPDNALLARLRKCSEDYDIDGIDQIMDELEKTDYNEDASLVEWLRKKVNESDFSGIVSKLSDY